MNKKAYDLVVKACEELADADPRLQRQQHESANMSAASIRDEIGGFLEALIQEREEVHSRALETMQPLLGIFDLALLQLSDLSYFAWKNRDSKSRVLWPQSKAAFRPHPNRVFYILTANLAQSFQAIRLLLLRGYEVQSRALVRTFIEVADLTLAIVAYEDIYKHYVTAHEDESEILSHWQKRLKPSIIRQRLAALDEERGLSKLTTIPAHEVRSETYRWFSLFSHVNYVAHIVGAHPAPVGGLNQGALAMLGEAGEITVATFQRVLLYVWLFFLNFDSLLWDVHGWRHFRGQRSRKWYRYRSKVFDTLFRENYKELQGIV